MLHHLLGLHLDETANYQWICKAFNREMFDFERNRITATFEQDLNPNGSTSFISTVNKSWGNY